MSDEPRFTASRAYALGRLERALRSLDAASGDAAAQRALVRVAEWEAVVAGMAGGSLDVGSRTPVEGVPPWVTPHVVHGGFATGRLAAETHLRLDERVVLRTVPDGVPGTTDRERLNLWYLSDAGQDDLLAALRARRYRIDVPEDAALMVVAWLLANGRPAEALDLVAELRPYLDRLRLTPAFEPVPQPAGDAVRLRPVREVRAAVAATTVPPAVATMLETLRVWNPLYDRLVALWCDTVDGEPPHLVAGAVAGGRPCRVWPADWTERRAAWLADYAAAVAEHPLSRAHRHPRGNFARLRAALEACEHDSTALSAREAGWVRRALANTVTKHGAPGTEPRAMLRAAQAVAAARPTHAMLARVLTARLDTYPADGGVPSLDPLAAPVADGEADGVPPGYPMPPRLLDKAARALEAPIEELVERGIVPSAEVLARVLPQLTARVVAADVTPTDLATLYGRTYEAFRRRRSLLLLNLGHQVRFDELPWVRALEPFRRAGSATAAATDALRHAVLVTWDAFPESIVPNVLLRELGALAERADVRLPLVEEVAADIFMGTFTAKWRAAAEIASRVLAGSLYARYYDLPAAWEAPRRWTSRWGKRTAEDFARLCAERARLAGAEGRDLRSVVGNGMTIEQAHVLTTHNLATLTDALDLAPVLRERAPRLAEGAFGWVVRQDRQLAADGPNAHHVVKNMAYAWRQGVYFLGFCDTATQHATVQWLRAEAGERLTPAVEGLAHVVVGGRFGRDGAVPGGRRLLGWSYGPHWLLAGSAP